MDNRNIFQLSLVIIIAGGKVPVVAICFKNLF